MSGDERNGPPPGPRWLPDRPLPPYAYVPGETPHPTRDPDGHSHDHDHAHAHDPGAAPVPPPDPARWRDAADYLWGLDLFNHGYYWEAHEAWEGLWVACGRRGPMAVFLQGLINLAAAGFKARLGNARGLAANAGTAARLFRTAAAALGDGGDRFMGLDVAELAALAERLRDAPPATAPAFDVVLRAE